MLKSTSSLRSAVDEREKLGKVLLACADWAYCCRTMLKNRGLYGDAEALTLSVSLLDFERRALKYWRVTEEMES